MNMDIDEMIKECEKIVKEDEVIVYGIGTGRIIPKVGMGRQMKKARKYITGLQGYLGVQPCDLWHTLIFFDTLNNAKAARNLMESKGIPVGKNVAPFVARKEYLNGKGQD